VNCLLCVNYDIVSADWKRPLCYFVANLLINDDDVDDDEIGLTSVLWSSVPVKLTAWKGLSPKWPAIGRVGH